jgi:ubiquinone biosynthesis protein UbiJ
MQPPPWLVHEIQQKIVLFLNHVLQAAPEALKRTRALSGRSVQLRWQQHVLNWVFTPAGLLERVEEPGLADLSLSLGDVSPRDLIHGFLQGEKPALRIEGDVQMAAEINWLADHVRWNPQEDLARLVGDAQAQALVLLGRRLAQALRGFVRSGASAERSR